MQVGIWADPFVQKPRAIVGSGPLIPYSGASRRRKGAFQPGGAGFLRIEALLTNS